MSERILITGGSGFLGASIAAHVLEHGPGAEVAIVDPKPPLELLRRFPGRVVHSASSVAKFLAEPLARTAFRTVVHLAWGTHPATSMQFPLQDLNANVGLGIKLLESCEQLGVETFVFASSGGTVYGVLERESADETHPTSPVSIYGAAKLSLEHYAQVYAWHRGFRAVNLRVSNPYGAYRLKGVPVGSIANFLLAAHEGRSIVLYGDGSVVRDYISIDDVASAFAAAIRQDDLPSGANNIGTGLGTSLAQIVDLVEEVSGRPLSIRYKSARSFDVPRNVLDCRRFEGLTGWRPQVALQDGARAMWDMLPRRAAPDGEADQRAM